MAAQVEHALIKKILAVGLTPEPMDASITPPVVHLPALSEVRRWKGQCAGGCHTTRRCRNRRFDTVCDAFLRRN